MAFANYFKRSEDQEVEESTLMTQRQIFSRNPEGIFFYELEPAVVVDVIRDDTHPIFEKDISAPKVDEKEWPSGYNDKSDIDYSWVGRVKARMIYSQAQTPTNELNWIYPLEASVKEYPLVNEMIIVSKYMGSYYYTRRLNTRNFINHDADFRTEHRYGMKSGVTSVNSPNLVGARNKSDLGSTINEFGSYLGKYFKANNKIRPLKHFEGDIVFESRFGNSMRFGGYEDDPDIDRGTAKGDGESYDGNYGNPMILIRNRQRITIDDEKKFQYNILEDINRDGSSIHITSGKTLSKFVSNVTHEYENVPQPQKKEQGGFPGLGDIASGKIPSIGDLPASGLLGGTALPNMPGNLTELATGGGLGGATSMLGGGSAGLGGMLGGKGMGGLGGSFGNPLVGIGTSLAQGDFGGAIGGGIGMFIGGPVGAQIGQRLGGMALPMIKKFVDAPGSPTAKSPSSRKKFTKAIATGKFSLNPDYERGIVSATKGAKSSSRSALKKTKAGSAILGASALGIDIPNANDLGIGPNDSSMFKIFKLAAFGIKAICASLNKKRGYDSDTEKGLGWLLSLGIDLTLLQMLMDLFARIRGLKFNFGSFNAFGLSGLLDMLCDWANQIEYKSTLLETFRNEANKTLSDKELTKQLGDGFMEKGTYDSYARNYPDFDMQYKSLLGADLESMESATKTFGQTSVSLTKDGETKSLIKFDPLTGLFRKKEGTIEQATTTGMTVVSSTGLASMGKGTLTPTGPSTVVTQEKATGYFSKEEITRESLKGTVLEKADMNAVALLDKKDLETLKDTSKVNTALDKAKKAYDKKFDEVMTETEQAIIDEPSGEQVFGKQLPSLEGNQIIMSSERIILSARTQEVGIFAKKKFFVTSDDELTFDSKDRFVLRTDTHTSVVSPTVHLGEYITRNHPVLKGDITTAWLASLCGWLSSHVHHDPYITTSVSAQQGTLAGLKASLPTLLSTRIFIAG